jgi:pimeloyl-ACP methyl ester carboxylesterase
MIVRGAPLSALVAIVCLILAAGLAPAGDRADDVVEIRIPLDHGKVHVRDVLEGLCREAGLEPGPRLAAVDWSIDVGTVVGRFQLRLVERIAPGAITTELQADVFVIRLDQRALVARSDQLLAAMERWVFAAAGWAPTERRFGMTVVTRDEPRAPMSALPAGATRAVVLVHGLDDPGWMWRDLAPRLLDDGHAVIRFEYPNDQPIADSADLLAGKLRDLRSIGIVRIDIVAHSMGGLVSRDVLTRQSFYAGDGSGGGHYPEVGRLIMLGTPNHGSVMVKFRGVAELREQVYRWFQGDWSLDDSLSDGSGEAARDLLPESDFLRRLNARPHPATTAYTIVAGRVSPVSEADLRTFSRRVAALARSMGMDDSAGKRLAGSMFREAIRGLGDGVVSLESASLEGVDDTVVVEANHLTMIVNLFPSDSMPPAIPIVLERLGREGTKGLRD